MRSFAFQRDVLFWGSEVFGFRRFWEFPAVCSKLRTGRFALIIG